MVHCTAIKKRTRPRNDEISLSLQSLLWAVRVADYRTFLPLFLAGCGNDFRSLARVRTGSGWWTLVGWGGVERGGAYPLLPNGKTEIAKTTSLYGSLYRSAKSLGSGVVINRLLRQPSAPAGSSPPPWGPLHWRTGGAEAPKGAPEGRARLTRAYSGLREALLRSRGVAGQGKVWGRQGGGGGLQQAEMEGGGGVADR